MANGCMRCATLKTRTTFTKDEIWRIARRLAYVPTDARAIERLKQAKATLASLKEEAEAGHECDTAKRDIAVASPRTGKVKQPINHGTSGGYNAHIRRGEPICDYCRAAMSRYRKDLRERARKKALAEKEKGQS